MLTFLLYNNPNFSFPSLYFSPLSSSSLIPQIHSHLIFPQKRADLPGTCTRYNKTRHRPSYQGWARKHSRRKRVPREDRRIRDNFTPVVWSPPKAPRQQLQYMRRRPSTDSCRLSKCCFYLCESLWTLFNWFCRLDSPSVLDPSGSHNFCSLLPWGYLSSKKRNSIETSNLGSLSTYVWLWVSAFAPISCQW